MLCSLLNHRLRKFWTFPHCWLIQAPFLKLLWRFGASARDFFLGNLYCCNMAINCNLWIVKWTNAEFWSLRKYQTLLISVDSGTWSVGQIELFPFLLRLLPIVKDIKELHFRLLVSTLVSTLLQNSHFLTRTDSKQTVGMSSLNKFWHILIARKFQWNIKFYAHKTLQRSEKKWWHFVFFRGLHTTFHREQKRDSLSEVYPEILKQFMRYIIPNNKYSPMRWRTKS